MSRPLIDKLGIKPGMRICIVGCPYSYSELLGNELIEVEQIEKGPVDFIHYFTKDAESLHSDITDLRSKIYPNGMVWISWPKKASKVVTDVDEDVIRNLALKNGLVDIKVCAVDDVWSGLKLVVPVVERR